MTKSEIPRSPTKSSSGNSAARTSEFRCVSVFFPRGNSIFSLQHAEEISLRFLEGSDLDGINQLRPASEPPSRHAAAAFFDEFHVEREDIVLGHNVADPEIPGCLTIHIDHTVESGAGLLSRRIHVAAHTARRLDVGFFSPGLSGESRGNV